MLGGNGVLESVVCEAAVLSEEFLQARFESLQSAVRPCPPQPASCGVGGGGMGSREEGSTCGWARRRRAATMGGPIGRLAAALCALRRCGRWPCMPDRSALSRGGEAAEVEDRGLGRRVRGGRQGQGRKVGCPGEEVCPRRAESSPPMSPQA
eukprot:364197-Chlamydomonas_euryale.AAC.1